MLVARPFHRPGWFYEEKYDRWRMLAYKDRRTMRLVSRRGRDHTATFPDIALTVASLPAKTLVLDGEVCVFDQALVSQFHLLTDDPEPGAIVTPPMYAVFDCLYLRGRDLRHGPLFVRRHAVEATLGDRHMLLFVARRLAADGIEAWADVEPRRLEGWWRSTRHRGIGAESGRVCGGRSSADWTASVPCSST